MYNLAAQVVHAFSVFEKYRYNPGPGTFAGNYCPVAWGINQPGFKPTQQPPAVTELSVTAGGWAAGVMTRNE